MALLELLRARDDLRHHGGRVFECGLTRGGKRRKRAADQVTHRSVLDVASRRDHHVGRDIGAAEVVPERFVGKRLHGFARPENRAPERVTLPEVLGEELVDQVVRRVLDHLDLFEDHLLLALDLVRRKCRTKHDVREQVDREREVLVEHLDVVAGVFLRGERVELAADGVDCLRDVLSGAGRGALEEHVLDEVGDPAARLDLVARASRQPHADRHRSNLRHRFGDQP